MKESTSCVGLSIIKLVLITRLEQECKHTGMPIWHNVNVWI